eukprot:362525-Chlamydomonas_euryale.AAC.2
MRLLVAQLVLRAYHQPIHTPTGSRSLVHSIHIHSSTQTTLPHLRLLIAQLVPRSYHGAAHPHTDLLQVARAQRPHHADREPLHTLPQAAQLLGQQRRQHIEPPADEVNRCATLRRFGIEHATGAHKRRHVGDVDAHL